MKAQKNEITQNKILEYLDSFGLATQLTDKEKKQFMEVAVAFQLNPFKREIYCIPYKTKNGRKLSIITGYEVYLKRAERSGKLAGWKVWTEGSLKDNTLKACIEIRRKDWEQPLYHEVYFSEYAQKTYNQKTGKYELNSMWASKPFTMIKKVAIAQGFRLAFPDELSGMPYTADELPDEMTTQKAQKPEIVDIQEVEEVEEAKEEPKTHNYKFLQEMQKIKKEVGEDIYYEVLSSYGFKKSSEITDRKTQVKVYTELKRLAETLKEAKNEVKEEQKQEPTEEQKRVAAKLKEVFGGEEIKE